MIAGRWFISPHAVQRYIERIEPGLTYEQALAKLIRVSDKAHRVKPWRNGLILYRGPRPRRLRLMVSEAVTPERPLPQLVTVYAGHDRGWGNEANRADLPRGDGITDAGAGAVRTADRCAG